MCFQCPPESELVSVEKDTTRQALSTTGRKRTLYQRCLSKSFLFLCPLSLMEARWKSSASRHKNDFFKHSAWAKLMPVLGTKVTFTLVISSTDWIPHIPVGSLSFLRQLPTLVSWGSLVVFSICSLGPYITLSGADAHGRR